MDIEPQNEAEQFHAGGVATVATAHAVHDSYTAYLPALLPVLIEKFSLTNAAAGLLSVFLQLPSLLQPLIGHIADRANLKLLIVLAPAVTGAMMSLLSIAPSYGVLIFFLLMAGISSAAFHATAPVLGSIFAGKRLGKGLSFWMVGGELGRALGPLVTVTAIAYLTLDGFPWLMVAGIVTSLFLLYRLKAISTRPIEQPDPTQWKAALLNMGSLMLPLSVILFLRSLMIATLTTFLPTFLTTEGTSLWMAGASLTILEVSGMAGAFLAGTLSDRYGRRRMLVISFTTAPVLMFLFLQTKNLWQFPLLILLGFFTISITPVLMAIVMENYPENRSFANGVYMATSFLIGAIAILLVGILSDLVDLRFTFMISAGLLPIGLLFIRMLPKSKPTRGPKQ